MSSNEELVNQSRQILAGAHYFPGVGFEKRRRSEPVRQIKSKLTWEQVPPTYWIYGLSNFKRLGRTATLERFMALSLVRRTAVEGEDIDMTISGFGRAKPRESSVLPLFNSGEKLYKVSAAHSWLSRTQEIDLVENIIFDRRAILQTERIESIEGITTGIPPVEVRFDILEEDPMVRLISYLALFASIQSSQKETPTFDIIAA